MLKAITTGIFIYLAVFGAVALIILVCWILMFREIYKNIKDMNKGSK